MHRFFSPPETIADGRITLGTDESRHLRSVLRLRAGDMVRVFDGVGREFEAEIGDIGKNFASLRIISEVRPQAGESPVALTLAAVMLKGEKFDLVVQKAVELGVSRLAPLTSARSDVRPLDAGKRIERWRRIALEAAKQCGRASIMTVEEMSRFDAFIGSNDGDAILFSERGGGRLDLGKPSATLTAIVGPEGGWDDAEIELARSAGCRVVTLGGRILRAETAAIAAAVIIQHRIGDIN